MIKKSHLKHVLRARKVQNFCSDFKFSQVMQQNTKGMVGNLIWKFTALYSSERILQIDQEFDKVIAMVRVAPFLDSQCITACPIP